MKDTQQIPNQVPVQQAFKINLVINNTALAAIDLSQYNIKQIVLLHAMFKKSSRHIFYEFIKLDPYSWRKLSQVRDKIHLLEMDQIIETEPKVPLSIKNVNAKHMYTMIHNEATLTSTRTEVETHLNVFKEITGNFPRKYLRSKSIRNQVKKGDS